MGDTLGPCRGLAQTNGIITTPSPQRKLGPRAARTALSALVPSFRWDDEGAPPKPFRNPPALT